MGRLEEILKTVSALATLVPIAVYLVGFLTYQAYLSSIGAPTLQLVNGRYLAAGALCLATMTLFMLGIVPVLADLGRFFDQFIEKSAWPTSDAGRRLAAATFILLHLLGGVGIAALLMSTVAIGPISLQTALAAPYSVGAFLMLNRLIRTEGVYSEWFQPRRMPSVRLPTKRTLGQLSSLALFLFLPVAFVVTMWATLAPLLTLVSLTGAVVLTQRSMLKDMKATATFVAAVVLMLGLVFPLLFGATCYGVLSNRVGGGRYSIVGIGMQNSDRDSIVALMADTGDGLVVKRLELGRPRGPATVVRKDRIDRITVVQWDVDTVNTPRKITPNGTGR